MVSPCIRWTPMEENIFKLRVLEASKDSRRKFDDPSVLGRKGWPFATTVSGANASTNLYSLVETCKAIGVDPYQYLVWLFRKLPLANTADGYAVVLPWNMPASCTERVGALQPT